MIVVMMMMVVVVVVMTMTTAKKLSTLTWALDLGGGGAISHTATKF
jgi:hypothetical protein